MIMDANRNVLWRNPDGVKPDQIARMNAFWGDDCWREAAYEARQGLFGDMIKKRANDTVIQVYRKRLQEKAGFNICPEPYTDEEQEKSINLIFVFASHNETGNRIAKSIFKKYEAKGYSHGV